MSLMAMFVLVALIARAKSNDIKNLGASLRSIRSVADNNKYYHRATGARVLAGPYRRVARRETIRANQDRRL